MVLYSHNLFLPPPFRKLKGYAFDPSLSLQLDTAEVNTIIYKVPWENLAPGPVGEYVEVIDYDPTVNAFYLPVHLDDPYVLADHGLAPSESNPLFHQQMVYAVAMTTIMHFERALGRKVLWASRLLHQEKKTDPYEAYVQRLRLYPHAMRDANAYYSPQKKAILFGYFSATPADQSLMMPNSLIFTCLSHDIIAHELSHAILDGMHRSYHDPTNPDVLAFHEAFADIVALFQHFTFPEVLKQQIARTRGNLASQHLLGQLAQQFATATGRYGSLRDAIGQVNEATGAWEPKIPSPEDYRRVVEPHERGSILVAAVFEAFITIYKKRTADLLRIASNGTGILPQGSLHPDLVNRLANEAAKAAEHVLNMCIRALDYCPPIDITFGDYLRAIITADMELVADDEHDYRLAFIDAFRRRGIYPEGIKTLSVESLRQPLIHPEILLVDPAKLPVDNLLEIIGRFLRDYAHDMQYITNREAIFNRTREYIAGKYDDQQHKIVGLHRRIGTKFSNSQDFVRLSGLVFIDDFAAFGIKASTQRNYKGPLFQIQNLRVVNRVGPNGRQVNQVVFSIEQECYYRLKDGQIIHPGKNEEKRDDYQVLKGACTLIFDLDAATLRFAICKPILDREMLKVGKYRIDRRRIEAQQRYQNRFPPSEIKGYTRYSDRQTVQYVEPFSFLHQMR